MSVKEVSIQERGIDVMVSLPLYHHPRWYFETTIDFISIFPPPSFLHFFFFLFVRNIKLGRQPYPHERRWMTHGPCSEVKRALCSLPSHRFIASPLLFDRKLSPTSIRTSKTPTRVSVSDELRLFLFFSPSSLTRRYTYTYILGWQLSNCGFFLENQR